MQKLKDILEMIVIVLCEMKERLEQKLGKMYFRMLACVLTLFMLLFISELIPAPNYITKSDPVPDNKPAVSADASSGDAADSSAAEPAAASQADSSAADSTSSEDAPAEVSLINNTPAAAGQPQDVNGDVFTPYESDETHVNALKGLKEQVTNALGEFPGEWSCYVKNLKTGDWFEINNHSLYPASMIKLFALCACYQQIEDGKLNEDELYATIFNMAAGSNNQSFNEIVWAMGKTYINEWCHKNGLPNTWQYHGLQPSTNFEGLETQDKINCTCVMDVGHAMEMIYNKECVSEWASERMLSILEQQKWTSKIPFGLPYNTRFANKTGDTYDVTHDAAIVFSPACDYILVLMCEQPNTSFKLKYCFIQVSKLVYQYFNPTVDY